MARKLCELVAESSAFQTRVGVASAADAWPWIHFPFARRSIEAIDGLKKPAAIVSIAPGYRRGRIAVASAWPQQAVMELILADDDHYPDDPESSAFDFCNFVDGVIQNLMAVQASGTRLPIEAIELTVRPECTPLRQAGAKGSEYWSTLLTVHWGI
jgi:hypothetical protein